MLAEIEDRDTGLNNMNIQDIFDHVFDCRGQIDDELVYECITTFSSPLDMSQGFNIYIDCQEECRDFFANAGQPLSDQQMMAKGQLHVGQTGLFKEKYLTWKRCQANQCMWNNFKLCWTYEFTDYETMITLTSKEAGFGPNAVVTSNNNTMSELESAMDNLEYAAARSNNVLETLTNTNKKLADQLSDANVIIKKLQ
eukprot:11869924-Ditylum_brightwellii.AAC.1